MRLADWQAGVHAVLTDASDAADALAPFLTGGAAPRERLAIHRRHYQASLVDAIRTRFPATAWLVGDDVLVGAAHHFVAAHPPKRPCMAEYGEHFPHVLGSLLAESAPYVADFAALEWRVGETAIATEHTAHLAVAWNVDALFLAWLHDDIPEQFALANAPGTVIVRGGRGAFTIDRDSPTGILT